MTLSKRIQSWRGVKRWSQATLAKRLGISPAAVAQWERAKTPTTPTVQNLDAIVRAMGMTHEQFYGRIPIATTTKMPAKPATKRKRAAA